MLIRFDQAVTVWSRRAPSFWSPGVSCVLCVLRGECFKLEEPDSTQKPTTLIPEVFL